MHVIGDEVDARQDQATANKDDNRGAGGEAKDLTAHIMPGPKEQRRQPSRWRDIVDPQSRADHHGEIYSNLPALFAGGSSTVINITREEAKTAIEPI